MVGANHSGIGWFSREEKYVPLDYELGISGDSISFYQQTARIGAINRSRFKISAGYSELLGDRHGPRRPAVHLFCDLEPPSEGVTLLTHQEVAKVFKAGAQVELLDGGKIMIGA